MLRTKQGLRNDHRREQEPPTISPLRSPPCGKVSCELLPGPATFRRFRDAGRQSRPSFFTVIETPRCIRATAIMSSRIRRGPRICKGRCIAVGYPEDMPIPARSIATRAGGQSLNNGISMARDTLGREAAPPAPTPIREGRTPRGRCCASSSSDRLYHRTPAKRASSAEIIIASSGPPSLVLLALRHRLLLRDGYTALADIDQKASTSVRKASFQRAY